jgi:hypothetical protein
VVRALRACFRFPLSVGDDERHSDGAEHLPETVVFHPRSGGCGLPIIAYKDKEVRDDDNDDHALVATLAVKVARLEAEVDRLENRFVLIARYIHVERAVLGVVALILTTLAAFAMSKLLGGH